MLDVKERAQKCGATRGLNKKMTAIGAMLSRDPHKVAPPGRKN
jgi:hypothetical protein